MLIGPTPLTMVGGKQCPVYSTARCARLTMYRRGGLLLKTKRGQIISAYRGPIPLIVTDACKRQRADFDKAS